jgi:hypothetical protein|tara:strand:+ start:19848 stop:19988 length:141 start_codon:yes stop_codon:yes gene_type:complete
MEQTIAGSWYRYKRTLILRASSLPMVYVAVDSNFADILFILGIAEE